MPFNLNADALKDEIQSLVKAQTEAARADLRADLEVEGTRIADRTTELAVRALGGDADAQQNLKHMWAQSVALASLTTMREQDRIAATMQLIALSAVKVLIGALASMT